LIGQFLTIYSIVEPIKIFSKFLQLRDQFVGHVDGRLSRAKLI